MKVFFITIEFYADTNYYLCDLHYYLFSPKWEKGVGSLEERVICSVQLKFLGVLPNCLLASNF